ncbi:MAG: hypothetical protein ACRCXZ_09205 [Patescibacteria group bacterium]
MQSSLFVKILLIFTLLQGVFFVFFFNQNIALVNMIIEKKDNEKKFIQDIEKYKINSDLRLNNEFSKFENTKEWMNYSKNRIPLNFYSDENPNKSPLELIR